MKISKFLLSSLISATGVGFGQLVSCHDKTVPSVESVTVSPTTLTLPLDSTAQLSATVLPAEAEQGINWSSSNEDIATVDENGNVQMTSDETFIGQSVDIIATSTVDESKSGKCTISLTAAEYISFADDSWENICLHANNGIEDLKQTYSIDFALEDEQHHKLKNSFVGLTREVTINNKKHKVVVIGQAEDTIADTNEQASLTFQFDNLISDSNGEALGCIFDDNYASTDYKMSKINTLLNNESGVSGWKHYDILKEGWQDSSLNKSVLTMMGESQHNSSWTSNIKTVTKKTYVADNTSLSSNDLVWRIEEEDFKLFLPSRSSMVECKKYPVYADEGDRYSYWEQFDIDDDADMAESEYFKKQSLDEQCISYWLSSNCQDGGTTTEDECWGFYVCGEDELHHPGRIIRQSKKNNIHALAPCFCI